MLSTFTFNKRLLSSSSLFAIRVVWSAYLRLLIFLLAVLIAACDSTSLVFHMMYSAYMLNAQGNNMQPWLILSQFWTSPLFQGNGNPLQYSCLENPMDGGAWWATVHWVAKSQTRLSDFIITITVVPCQVLTVPSWPACRFLTLACS